MKKMCSLVLALVMCLALCVPAFASENSVGLSADDISLVAASQETVLLIEDALKLDGSSVEAELTDLIATFREAQNSCNEEGYQKLQALIDSTNELLNVYQEYQSRTSIVPRNAGGVTKVGIAAVSAYFQSNRYYLATELIIHVGENNTLNSIYVPQMLTALRQQSCWNTYRNGYPNSGVGSFSTGDLYYAINLYNWAKDPNTKRITLSDRYDFQRNDIYSGLAGTAINFLAIAQENGEILPFYTTVYNL